MKVLRLILEENDGHIVRRVERTIAWEEYERLSVLARDQITGQTIYDLQRELDPPKPSE